MPQNHGETRNHYRQMFSRDQFSNVFERGVVLIRIAHVVLDLYELRDISEKYGFKHRTQWVVWPHRVLGTELSEFLAAFICVPKWTHRVFFCRTHRICCRTQWVSSSETVLSKQYSARFLDITCLGSLSLLNYVSITVTQSAFLGEVTG